MLLKQLELHGLKSFADKTVLDLTQNVTAIVGPNGSGKSNITDGIRWVLGERDARNLRGAKGEDLIFAGTEKRPRMGQAQATLYFDNSSGFFPVEFKEVSISRKISRDGVSQFFINKSEVRLKDLIDFLARVKLGARGLTVINQGQSDAFIVATPTERREMIEEMLGLKEYQLKKADAERKLKNTSFNLEKAHALIEELKPHLRLLRRQSTRYANRERLAEELLELENSFYGSRLLRLREESKRLQGGEKNIASRIKEEEPGFRKIEEEFEKISKSEPEAMNELKKTQEKKQIILSKRTDLQRELGRVEAQLEFQSQESLDENADIKSALKEIKNIAVLLVSENDMTRLREMAKNVLDIIERLFVSNGKSSASTDIKKKYKELIENLKSFDKEVEELGNIEKRYQDTLEGFNRTFREAYEKVELARKKRDELVAEKNKNSLARERVEMQLGTLAEELSQIGRSIASFEAGIKENNASSGTLIDEDAARRKMVKIRQDLASIGEVDESIIKEAHETEERNEFLTKQVNDLDKAVGGLTILIKELEEKIYTEFNSAMKAINTEFNKMIHGMFGGGKAKLIVRKSKSARGNKESNDGDQVEGNKEQDSKDVADSNTNETVGIDIEISLPEKRIKGLDMLSGGERSLVSIAALFALISVSPPPFLVLDEIDAALDEKNAKRFGQILSDFSKSTQFVVVSHNRATMEAADVLYGVTMSSDGTSKLVSLKLT